MLHLRGFLTSRAYAPGIRASLVLCLIVFGALVAGCGGSSTKQGSPGTPPTGGATTTSAATTTAGAGALQGAGTSPVEGKPSGSETALLERIAIGHHEGYDRVVFQFKNGLPGYRVRYVQPPLVEDGSGTPVNVKGAAFVVVRMEPASGFDLSTGEGVLVYTGPKRIEGSTAGTSIVQELTRTGDFEAVLNWAIGLGQRVDFRVTTAESPARLIVDFRSTPV